MKKNPFLTNSTSAIIALLIIVLVVSCEDNPAKIQNSSAPPTLERVSLVTKDSTTSEGFRDNEYLIIGHNLRGTRTVTFNGYPADINPTLVTNENIIVTVPDSTPYRNASDSLVVTTNKGSARLPFKIGQPAPVITDFSPKTGGPGDIVTITGMIFDGVDTVRFGDEDTGKLAEIESSTSTQVKVKVPEGVVNAKIYLITPGGTAISEATFGFKYLVYGDELNVDWANQSYTGTATFDNTENVKTGTNSIKMVTSGGYGALKLYNNATPVNLDGFTAIKLSIFAADASERVQVVVNEDYNNGYPLTLTQGQYTDFTVPLSEVNNPSQLQSITVQDQTGQALTFYVDDLGLI